jgi:hypothetical protein
MASKSPTAVLAQSEQGEAPTFAVAGSEEPNVTDLFEDATRGFWPTVWVLESEGVVTQLGPTELNATGAAVEATTGEAGSSVVLPQSGEIGATVGGNQSVVEYSEVGWSAQDPTMALVTEDAGLAASDILKPSGVQSITAEPFVSDEALASEGEVSELPVSEVLMVSEALSTVKIEQTVEDSESRTVTATSGVLVRPSLGDLSAVGGASPPLEVAPSKTFGPSAVHGETDASEATELVYLSVREQASGTRRGSGAPVQQTRWLDGSDSAGASRVEKRTDTPDAVEVGGSDKAEETARVQITRKVVDSESRGGTAQYWATDHPPSTRDFERSEALMSGAPQVGATNRREETAVAPQSDALAPSGLGPLTRPPLRTNRHIGSGGHRESERQPATQVFGAKSPDDTNTARATSRTTDSKAFSRPPTAERTSVASGAETSSDSKTLSQQPAASVPESAEVPVAGPTATASWTSDGGAGAVAMGGGRSNWWIWLLVALALAIAAIALSVACYVHRRSSTTTSKGQAKQSETFNLGLVEGKGVRRRRVRWRRRRRWVVTRAS